MVCIAWCLYFEAEVPEVLECMSHFLELYIDSLAFGASGPSHPYRATLASNKGYLVEHSLRQTV